MIYRPRNLTGCVVVLQSKAGMRRFLKDRQLSVASKMRKAIKAGRRAGHPESDALIEEMTLILALQDEMKRYQFEQCEKRPEVHSNQVGYAMDDKRL